MKHLLAALSIVVVFGSVAMAQQKSANGQPGKMCSLKVSGMVCSACANTVEKAVKKIDGVKTIKADQPTGIAAVTYDPAKTTPEAIAKVINGKTPFKAEVQKP